MQLRRCNKNNGQYHDNGQFQLRRYRQRTMNNVVMLSTTEICTASFCGVMRQAQNIRANRKPYYGAGTLNDWQLHIEGCLGEFALAKFLGINWSGVGKLRAPDVGEMDVRTRSRDDYELILHPEDPGDRIFWLLTGVNGTYCVRGWCHGRDGKLDRFWKDPAGGRPAFFVPHKALYSPEQFINKSKGAE